MLCKRIEDFGLSLYGKQMSSKANATTRITNQSDASGRLFTKLWCPLLPGTVWPKNLNVLKKVTVNVLPKAY